MLVIDLDGNRRKAFARGFWRGLAAPLMVYSAYSVPIQAEPQIMEVENPANKTDGVHGDWRRVGHHLHESVRAEMKRHG